jgi:hypothetical protein
MKQLNFKIVLLFLTIYVCPHRTLAQKDTLLYRTLIQDSILIPQKSQATIEGNVNNAKMRLDNYAVLTAKKQCKSHSRTCKNGRNCLRKTKK